MAAYTGSVTGNWADTATWGGSGPPVAGDQVTINTGITVTVPVSTTATCGASPTTATATAELTINGTGQLVINGTLNVRGPLDVTSGGVVTINGGGTLNIDPSNQATTTEYRCRFGVSGTGKLVLNDNATITSPAGYSWYHAGGAFTNAGQIDVNGTASNYALIQRMQRSASNIGWTPGNAISSAGKYEISHCIVDECDDFSFTGTGTFSINFDYVYWQNSTGTQNLILNTSTVTKVLRNCTFDKNVNTSGGWGTATAIDVSECYFDPRFTSGGTTGGYVDGGYNVKRATATDGPAPFYPASGGTLISHEVLWLDAVINNPHFGYANSGLAGARTMRGLIFAFEGTADNGDCTAPDTTDNVLTTHADCLFIPNANGNHPGTWCSQLAASAQTIAFNHNTGVISDTGNPRGVSIGETNDCNAGRVASLKSNLAFAGANDPSSEFLFDIQASQTTNNPLDQTQADYNWIVSANANTAAAVYSTGNGTATQTTPTAANDIYGEAANFIDGSYRSMRSWAAWWGARIGANGDGVTTPDDSATAVNARLLLLAMHDGSFAESVTATAMQLCVQYLRRGYIPTNAAGRAAGHDGLTPGMFGAWAPALSGLTASASGASCTTNAADGTLYWVLTSSATAPDWDRIIAGQDHTGASLPAAQKGSVAVSTTSPSWSYSPDPGTYYLHIVHSADATTNGDAGQEAYLRTSAEVSSSSIAVSGGGTGRSARSPIRSFTRSLLQAA